MRLPHLAIPVLALALLAGALPAQSTTPRPPNIVHVIADDVAWDDLSCYGCRDIATPNLDRLAREGLRCTDFQAPHSTCTPTRAAILTGGYAQRAGLPQVLFPDSKVGLAAAEPTIAEVLRQKGYATALVGKWHLGCQPPFLPTRHGFDAFFGIPYPNDHGPERLDKNGRTRGFPPIPLYRGEAVVEQPAQLAKLPERFVAEAVQFIAAHKAQPFYLHFANIETHTPWLVTRRFQGQSKAGVYGDAVQCLDWAVGELLAAVDAAGLANDTLFVFQSDNGPLLHEDAELEGIYGHAATVDTARRHALRGGKYQSRYEGGCRVACLVRWPGHVAAGTQCEALCAGFDWFPTFAAAAGAVVDDGRVRDGRSLLPLLEGRAKGDPERVLLLWEGWRVVAVRQGPWKLVLPKQPDGACELYDLAADLGEQRDVAAAHGERVAAMRALAAAGAKELGSGKPGPAVRPAGKVD